MAKKPGNVFETRLDEIDRELDERTKKLTPLQDKLRADPQNAELRAQVQAEKLHFIRLTDERGEVARAISRLAGGKQHSLPVG